MTVAFTASSFTSLLLVVLQVTSLCSKVSAGRTLRSAQLEQPEESWRDRHLLQISYCTDTTSTFPLIAGSAGADDQRDCPWLKQSLEEHGHLCERFEVSSLCRITCGVCEDTVRAVELLKKCENKLGIVKYGGEDVTCQWIKEHQAENPNTCETTNIALSCPVVCDFYGLPSCTKVDPQTTTGRKEPTDESANT
ncbi:hypothetical protein ACA910_007869 [Epithemia clementina (nom. ined.)]